ncbi:MAG: hypothetical protein Q8888_00415 [Vigna little leaf phytoplasma]|nr:hypothetical protein [Vigna little leaf phytoplasma]
MIITPKALLSRFQKIIANKKLSHIYLIEGINDEILQKIIFDLVYLFLKDNSDCINLKKMIKTKNHPNFYYLNSQNNVIKKEQILEMQRYFTQTSLFSSKKVYVIDKAEDISHVSSNSLLNFLENPMNNQILGFLITNNRYLLLSTILSRVQVFSLITEEEALNAFSLENLTIDNSLDQFLIKLLTISNNIYSNKKNIPDYYPYLKQVFLEFFSLNNNLLSNRIHLWVKFQNLWLNRSFFNDFIFLVMRFCLYFYNQYQQFSNFLFSKMLLNNTWLGHISSYKLRYFLNLLTKIEKQSKEMSISSCLISLFIQMEFIFNSSNYDK